MENGGADQHWDSFAVMPFAVVVGLLLQDLSLCLDGLNLLRGPVSLPNFQFILAHDIMVLCLLALRSESPSSSDFHDQFKQKITH